MQSVQRSAIWRNKVPFEAQVSHGLTEAISENTGGSTGFLHFRALHLVRPVFLHFGQSTLEKRPWPLQPRQFLRPGLSCTFRDPPQRLQMTLIFFFPRHALQRTLFVPSQALQGLRALSVAVIVLTCCFWSFFQEPFDSVFQWE